MKGPDSELRMVVFCTNIAETSVTIKNVRLVIDPGFANEAHFDSKRYLTVMKKVSISCSSADQRKGRAGRAAPGHGVRLYEENDLICLNIEPTILRSPLDLVVLQIIYLRFNPMEFPFMDPPNPTVIHTSLDLLRDPS